jgi:hypothetical protein
LRNDCKVAEAIKTQKPETKIGFVGAHAAVLPTETLKASPAIDWVGRKEFDFTCKEVSEGRDLANQRTFLQGKDGKIKHNAERELIHDMDVLPWVADVYKRDLQIREIFHRLPAASLHEPLHRPRLPGAMHLLPLAADHRRPQISRPFRPKRRREMAYAKKFSRKCRNFSSTTTPSPPTCRARGRSPRKSPLGLTWSCNSRANIDYDTIKSFKDNGPAPVPRRLRSGNQEILNRIKKGIHGREAPVYQGLHKAGRPHPRHVHPRSAG